MVTAFRYRRTLVGYSEVDILRSPSEIPGILAERDRIGKKLGIDPGLISVCSTPLPDIHGERIVDDLEAARVAPRPRRKGNPPRDPLTIDDVRAIAKAMGGAGNLADKLNVATRTVQHWMEPEGASGHRKPRGTALKILLELRRELRDVQTKTPGI